MSVLILFQFAHFLSINLKFIILILSLIPILSCFRYLAIHFIPEEVLFFILNVI